METIYFDSLGNCIEKAYRNNFKYVITMAGEILLSEWTPYGKREGHYVKFAYCGDEIREYVDSDKAHNVPLYLGIWRLTK